MDVDKSIKYVISHIDTKTELCDIMNQTGSDKGTIHNYTIFYSHLFQSLKDNPIKIFEMGLGSSDLNIPSNMGIDGVFGASLYGWRRFFTHSDTKIFGADIDDKIKIDDNNIKTFYCDQTNPQSLYDLYNSPDMKDVLFDIIIDDGLHTFEACWTTFNNTVKKLAPGGVYIIEDVNYSMYHQLFEKNVPGGRLVQIPRINRDISDNVLFVYSATF